MIKIDQDKIILKHLGPATPEWVVDNCKRMLDELGELESTDCGRDGMVFSCKQCGSTIKKNKPFKYFNS